MPLVQTLSTTLSRLAIDSLTELAVRYQNRNWIVHSQCGTETNANIPFLVSNVPLNRGNPELTDLQITATRKKQVKVWPEPSKTGL
jgi:hypothetical protein